jgi:membrane associated rhomboid family serine protease
MASEVPRPIVAKSARGLFSRSVFAAARKMPLFGSMRTKGDSDDFEPVTFLGGHPIHTATVIVAAYVATLVATTIAVSAGAQPFLLQRLAFSSEAVLHHGWLWQLVSFATVNPPSFNFAFQAAMLWFFGRELEKFFGRRIFLRFYAIAFSLTPILLSLVGLFHPTTAMGIAGGFATFVAFATLYPRYPLYFGIHARDLAYIIIGIQTLIYIAGHGWSELFVFWCEVVFAYFFVGYERGEWNLPSMPSFRRSKFRVLPTPERASRQQQDTDSAEMDALLDKIARSGIASLTAAEKSKLEKARQALIKKEGR